MNGRSGRRCAVVYNPIKVVDELRDAISRQATAMGCAGAYFIAAAKAVGRTPIDMRIVLDDHHPIDVAP